MHSMQQFHQIWGLCLIFSFRKYQNAKISYSVIMRVCDSYLIYQVSHWFATGVKHIARRKPILGNGTRDVWFAPLLCICNIVTYILLDGIGIRHCNFRYRWLRQILLTDYILSFYQYGSQESCFSSLPPTLCRLWCMPVINVLWTIVVQNMVVVKYLR